MNIQTIKKLRNAKLTRAGLALIVLTQLACQPSEPSPMDTPPDAQPSASSRRERLARVIREYDSQGIHRTGSAVDNDSADWLAGLVEEAGFEPELQQMEFERIDTEAAFLEITEPDGTTSRFEGIPLIDSASFTTAEGLTGTLGGPQSEASIVVARWPPNIQYYQPFHEIRTSPARRALVVLTGGGTFDVPPEDLRRVQPLPEGYALINADRYLDPYGHPVLQLPSTDAEAVVAARDRGARGRVVTQVSRKQVLVSNVLTQVLGSDPSAAPVVVMTPRSGWWQVASERGGGVAIWVELLHALQDQPPRRTVHFVASTGHELGHVGLDHYLEEKHQLIANAHLWLHLGANFAAAVGSQVLLQASDEELKNRALARMNAVGAAPASITPTDVRPYGEAREIYDGGGRFISLLGGNGQFHSPADRWPESVDMERLEKLADAFVSLIRDIANEP